MTAATVVSTDRLAEGLSALGLPVDDARLNALATYLNLLVRWNGVYNLTSIRDPERMRAAHLFDSLAVLRPLQAALAANGPLSPHLLDVGSGAGLPGLPLAIMWPELTMTLVEPVGKKVAFLRNTIGVLGLQRRVDVAASRIEQLFTPRPPDLIISRAFASLADFVTGIEPVAGVGTRVFAMKGQLPTAEIESLPAGWQVLTVSVLAVPELDAQRHLIQLARSEPASIQPYRTTSP